MRLSIFFITVFFCVTAYFMIYPPQSGSGQVVKTTDDEISNLIKEARTKGAIEDQKRKELVTAISEQEPKVIYRVKKVPVIREIPASGKRVLLRINGEVYEPVATEYKGYVIVDINLDSLRGDTQPNIHGHGVSIPDGPLVWRTLSTHDSSTRDKVSEEKRFFRRLFKKKK